MKFKNIKFRTKIKKHGFVEGWRKDSHNKIHYACMYLYVNFKLRVGIIFFSFCIFLLVDIITQITEN